MKNKNLKYLDTTYWTDTKTNTLDLPKIGIIDGGRSPENFPKKNLVAEKSFTIPETSIQNTSMEAIHGTVVSNIITDICPGARIFIAQVIHPNSLEVCGETELIEAFNWLSDQKVKIINISMGIRRNCDGSCLLSDYIKTLYEKDNIITISSSGNIDTDTPVIDYISCPGCSPYSISVGALDKQGHPSNIINANNKYAQTKPNLFENGYVTFFNIEFTGSSFSAPIVTGLIANHYYSPPVLSKFNNINSIIEYIDSLR